MEFNFKQKYFVGFLSFSLPGLGQLYHQKYLWALFFFSIFSAVQSVPDLSIALPLPIFVSALHSFKISMVGKKKPLLDWCYGAVALVGLFQWTLFYFVLIHPVGALR